MTLSPRKILVDTFPAIAKNFPVSGGWGESRADACVIDPYSSDVSINDFNPWKVIDTFVEKSIYMHFVVMRNENDRYGDISWKLFHRKTLLNGGKVFEKQTYEVTAYPEKDLALFAQGSDGLDDPLAEEEALEVYYQQREACKKIAMMEFWFDVTACQLTRNFIVDFPWTVASLGRGSGKTFDNGDNSLGYSVEYEGLYDPSIRATVELYSMQSQAEAEVITDALAAEHLKSVLQEVIDLNLAAEETTCQLVKSGVYRFDDDSPAFQGGEFRLDSRLEGKHKYFVFLRNYGDHFIKIRVFMPTDSELSGLALTFAQEIYKSLAMSGASFDDPIVWH